MARYTRKELMERVQISLRELHLSSMTMADKKRLFYVEQGLYALDEEQAILKSGIEELLEEYQSASSPPTKGGLSTELERREAKGKAAENLVTELKKLVSDNLPRVNYPDKKLIEGGRREIPLSGPAPSKRTVRQLASVQKNLGKIPKTKAKVK